jgi:hypothetical protein
VRVFLYSKPPKSQRRVEEEGGKGDEPKDFTALPDIIAAQSKEAEESKEAKAPPSKAKAHTLPHRSVRQAQNHMAQVAEDKEVALAQLGRCETHLATLVVEGKGKGNEATNLRTRIAQLIYDTSIDPHTSLPAFMM